MVTRALLKSVSPFALIAAATSPAFAQDAQNGEQPAAEDDTGAISQIIVSATRRQTDLQATPVAVSAIDQSLIRGANADDIRGLAIFVPNFSAETITGFNAASFAMRGVGVNNIIVYFEPPVAVLVDDFVVPSVQTQLLDTFDIEQVEVLRGPQGTLFGKNTTGGAVTVRTIRPKMDVTQFDGMLQAGSFGTILARAALNVPLIENTLSLRLVGGYEKSDGFYRNGACFGPVTGIFPGSKFEGAEGCLNGDRIGGKDVVNARAKLLFEPTPNITALFQYEILRDRSDSVPSVNENSRFTGETPFLTDILNTGSFQPNNSDPLDNAGITLRDDALLFAGRGQRIDVDGLYANIDFDFGFGTLTTVTGWRQQKSRLPNSYPGHAPIADDGQPLSLFDATRDDDRETFQQELRFSTDFGGPFDMIVGAFYQSDDVDFCVSQILGFLDLVNPLPVGTWNDTPYILCNAQEAESKALFGEGTFEITPDLTLTGGLRYTWDDKTWRGRQQVFISQLDPTNPGLVIDEALDASVYNFPTNVIRLDDSWRELTWRASLGYQATPDLFLYATTARGFKGGGFNDQIGGFAAFGDDLDAFRAAAQATDPETADSYEIGLKTELFNNRLRFNLTGFYVDYTDLQRQLNVPIFVNGVRNQVTRFENAASATVKGIEAELTARPTDRLTFRGVLGFQDAEYGEYDAEDAGYDLSTSPLDRAPRWQWTINGTYRADVSNNHELVFDSSVAYQASNLFTQAIDDPLGNTFLDSRTLVNASITLNQVDNQYYVRVIGQNLTDERYRTASQNVAGLWLNSQFGAPRYFGVELGVSFGGR